MQWTVFLSGEIHTDWREKIIEGCQALDLPVTFTSAVTDHDASDSAGDFLGVEGRLRGLQINITTIYRKHQ